MAMAFARTDEQRMLAEMLEGALGSSSGSWGDAFAQAGLDDLGVPTEEGGPGGGLRDAAVVAAALGRAAIAQPWSEHWAATALGARGEGPRASTGPQALAFANDASARERAADAVCVLHCAEMVGLSRSMLAQTVTHANERRQFGVAIGSFQALRHRMADMAMMIERAEAITGAAVDAVEDGTALRATVVSAARVVCEDVVRAVGDGAVQIHGAMGLTAELRLGAYYRRAYDLSQADGTAAAHLRRYAEIL